MKLMMEIFSRQDLIKVTKVFRPTNEKMFNFIKTYLTSIIYSPVPDTIKTLCICVEIFRDITMVN